MNIILEYSMETRVPKFTTHNTTLPLLFAFMDDLSLMTTKVSGAQTLLSQCITALTWAGLEFRADKSRSIDIVKSRSMNTRPFFFQKHQSTQKFHLTFVLIILDQSGFWVNYTIMVQFLIETLQQN